MSKRKKIKVEETIRTQKDCIAERIAIVCHRIFLCIMGNVIVFLHP